MNAYTEHQTQIRNHREWAKIHCDKLRALLNPFLHEAGP